ncbi:PREDICTED: LOW QUALITY PROTEIN: elongation factor Tu GTP-binding domain-containing protein 1 [Dufourea novaeangliae]|uniref:LOW QUALITY PROTEIN: elongation factor Tu GTP-binding domain-containing protein 1 n=1 Tax=Dufourea novaeangliae TaxID=178035 RepID=UPI00076731B6|nr:PREDICTED: LOW QUALITY PROTEIN: elongation factor Tu GTP-binding domain-containing protein 1 [Dufourea novaeangliae]
MRLVSSEKLSNIQRNPASIRNICILAHVDHGKTTLADSLVASNGIISNKLAGKLRYLDSRPDEQLRGITMKSSSITLYHMYDRREFAINLIDSPGHVDFASEVSTAVRLCDGAIIVIDVVEGVCPQTRSALSTSYTEGLKGILVLNKIDRLITEMKLSPFDAYVHLTQVLEQVNAVMGELFASDVMAREGRTEVRRKEDVEGVSERSLTDWQSALENMDDSGLYFSPEQGNVLFSSATDGWGFGVKDFAKIFSAKLGFSEAVLLRTLWGDFYVNTKTKRIMKGAQEKAKKPLFVQLILDNIWTLYETITVRKDKEKIGSMAERLDIKLTTRDLRHTDPKVQLQAVCSQWLPLARACLDAICENVPAPNNLTSEKVERLLSGNCDFTMLPDETQRLKQVFLACDSSASSPVIVFVSKMFPVERRTLPEYKTKPLTPEELAQRKELARIRHAEKITKEQESTDEESGDRSQTDNTTELSGIGTRSTENEAAGGNLDTALIAFARGYSGSLRNGSTVFVLGPKHDPREALERRAAGEQLPTDESITLKDLKHGRHVTRVTVRKLYLLMGRELEPVGRSLSSTVACPPFSETVSSGTPIMRVALEPKHPNDLPALIDGLKLLNQADACAIVHIQETGEIVLSTAGEVHLERCLEDLRFRYAKVDVNVSEPIVPFKETVVPPPTVDMVNEAIEKKPEDVSLGTWTANRESYFEIDARPLPDNITKILEKHSDLIKNFYSHYDKFSSEKARPEDATVVETEAEAEAVAVDKKEETDLANLISAREQRALAFFENELSIAFREVGQTDALDKIWSFGPRNCGPNVFLNETDYRHKQFSESHTNSLDPRFPYETSMVSGFQLATLAGPLCEEPMMGVCFVLKKWEVYEDSQSENSSQSHGHMGGRLMSACKEACRRAFNTRHPRLVTPMYTCSVLVNSDVLGKLYAAFGKRQGRVIAAESAGFGRQFRVLATLPVPESFQLTRELRTQTSGLASPQLVFSHWEVIEQDPYWTPSTDEEYLHFGDKADSGNRAKKYIDAVRRRKGLAVDSQLVTHAEKQRTLSKKK